MDTSLDSFTDVIRRHQASVYAVAYGVTGDRALSEDVTQETFVVAWRDRSSLRDPDKLPQWLRGIARNLAKQARDKAGLVIDASGEVAGPDPRDESVANEEARMTWDALRELPESYREALVLYYWEDNSARDVAAALEISEQAVQQRLSRGRGLLREEVLRRVEGALRRGRPGAALTAAIVAAIVAGATSTASAAPALVAAPKRFATNLVFGTGAALVAILIALVLVISDRVDDGAARGGATEHTAAAASNLAGSASRSAIGSGPSSASVQLPASGASDDAASSAAGDDDPNGAYYSIRIDGWSLLPRELYSATEKCFTPELVGSPAQLRITVRDHAIASVDVAAAGTSWTEHITLLDETGQALTNEQARARIAAKKDLISGRGWLEDGGSAFAPPDDGMPIMEFLAACTTAHLVGQPAPVGDGQMTITLTGDRVVPKRPDSAGYADLEIAKGASRGPADAKVTIVAFLGLEDRFSQALLGTLDQVLTKYPRDVRVVIKPVTLKSNPENMAAEAVLAAHAQGALWPMLARVSNQRGLTADALIAIAGELGLDTARMRADLTQHTYRDEVEMLQDQRTTMEITALPSCLVNGKRVHGAVSIESFDAAILDALAR